MKVYLLMVCAVSLLPLPAFAGSQDDARVVLHAETWPSGKVCNFSPNSQEIPCSEFTTEWPLNSAAAVYLVIAQGNPDPGVLGIRLSVDYDASKLGADF